MNTRNRFSKGDRTREEKFFKRIIRQLNRDEKFRGISDIFISCEGFRDQKALKDLKVIWEIDNQKIVFPIEIQETSSRDFKNYKQIRLDYISAYEPKKPFKNLKKFNKAVREKKIKILKSGKLFECESKLLFFYVYNEAEDHINNIYILNIECLQKMRTKIEEVGDFRTNIKDDNEDWGSAFIAVYPHSIKHCIIKNLAELKQIFILS